MEDKERERIRKKIIKILKKVHSGKINLANSLHQEINKGLLTAISQSLRDLVKKGVAMRFLQKALIRLGRRHIAFSDMFQELYRMLGHLPSHLETIAWEIWITANDFDRGEYSREEGESSSGYFPIVKRLENDVKH